MGDAQQLRRSEPADGYHWPVPPASRDCHKVQEGGDERTGVVGESEKRRCRKLRGDSWALQKGGFGPVEDRREVLQGRAEVNKWKTALLRRRSDQPARKSRCVWGAARTRCGAPRSHVRAWREGLACHYFALLRVKIHKEKKIVIFFQDGVRSSISEGP